MIMSTTSLLFNDDSCFAICFMNCLVIGVQVFTDRAIEVLERARADVAAGGLGRFQIHS